MVSTKHFRSWKLHDSLLETGDSTIKEKSRLTDQTEEETQFRQDVFAAVFAEPAASSNG